jgi:hypothetical protein
MNTSSANKKKTPIKKINVAKSTNIQSKALSINSSKTKPKISPRESN